MLAIACSVIPTDEITSVWLFEGKLAAGTIAVIGSAWLVYRRRPTRGAYNQNALMTTAAMQRPATSHIRWTVCALLFFATTINYVDRQVLSLLAKTLETSIGWNDIQYSNITSAFTAAYAMGLLGAGRLLDKYGTRIGFAIAVTIWSFAAMAHGLATSALTFGIARAFLGLGEAANFPACIKTVAEWFPKKERAQATGIFNSGSNIGAVAAIIAVPLLTLHWGWQASFIATGALGFYLAGLLAADVLQAGRALEGFQIRAGTDPGRSARPRKHPTPGFRCFRTAKRGRSLSASS